MKHKLVGDIKVLVPMLKRADAKFDYWELRDSRDRWEGWTISLGGLHSDTPFLSCTFNTKGKMTEAKLYNDQGAEL